MTDLYTPDENCAFFGWSVALAFAKRLWFIGLEELNDCYRESFLTVVLFFCEKESPKLYSTGLTATFDSTLGWAALVKNLERAAFLYEVRQLKKGKR